MVAVDRVPQREQESGQQDADVSRAGSTQERADVGDHDGSVSPRGGPVTPAILIAFSY